MFRYYFPTYLIVEDSFLQWILCTLHFFSMAPARLVHIRWCRVLLLVDYSTSASFGIQRASAEAEEQYLTLPAKL